MQLFHLDSTANFLLFSNENDSKSEPHAIIQWAINKRKKRLWREDHFPSFLYHKRNEKSYSPN